MFNAVNFFTSVSKHHTPMYRASSSYIIRNSVRWDCGIFSFGLFCKNSPAGWAFCQTSSSRWPSMVGPFSTRTASTVGRPRKVPLLPGAIGVCSTAMAAWPSAQTVASNAARFANGWFVIFFKSIRMGRRLTKFRERRLQVEGVGMLFLQTEQALVEALDNLGF